jgi:fumarate reductase flavoprotein subunit
VRNWWDEPSERLYAAGEIVGGFHGSGYMTGTALGQAAIFGRLAGIHAAQEESENDNVDKVGK